LSAAVVLAAALVTDAAALSPPERAFSTHRVARVDLKRAANASRAQAARTAAGRRRCVSVDHMAGAVVIGDRAVELTMASGIRWRLNFARDCPALSFYQGFYYRRGQGGELCAARDAVIARSGGECPIESITTLRPVGRRHL